MYIPLFNKSNYTLLSSLLKIDDIIQYEYTDKGKKTSDSYCSTATSPTDYECPKDKYDKRGYTGINITDGKIKMLYNLPPDEIEMANSPVLTETTLNTTAKARFITLEEYEEFVTEITKKDSTESIAYIEEKGLYGFEYERK